MVDGTTYQLGCVVRAHGILLIAHDACRLILCLLFADALEVGAELGAESIETAPAGGAVGGGTGGGVEARGLVR